MSLVEFETIIGLEVHVHLKTASKLFCACAAGPGGEPNSSICEVCAGLPGALPHTNKKAVELAAKAGLALGCRVNERSVFSRKNYFYPDLPNGFQTSQLEPPICEGGGLDIETGAGPGKYIRLNRIHLEDDAGKCVHEPGGGSLVDLNRAGSPLIEIVTEPDIRGAPEASAFLKKLHAILVHIGVTEGRLEEGDFRCDVNISLRPQGGRVLGKRSEIKNLNSFRHVEAAILFEAGRQRRLLAGGAEVAQETRLFDPDRQETRPLRSKEDAHDYRYFPQPDLPPVEVSPELLARLKAELPELPEAAKARLVKEYGLPEADVDVLFSYRGGQAYFEAVVAAGASPKRAAGFMLEVFLPACQKDGLNPLNSPVGPKRAGALISMIDRGDLSRQAAYKLFPDLLAGAEPEAAARAKGLIQVSDLGALTELARDIVAAHPNEAAQYRAGKEKVISFFVGRIMKETRGAANPGLVNKILKEVLAA